MRTQWQIWRPHAIFLLGLLLIVGLAGWRGWAQWRRLGEAGRRVDTLSASLQTIDEIQLLLDDPADSDRRRQAAALAAELTALAEDPFSVQLRRSLEAGSGEDAAALAATVANSAARRLGTSAQALVVGQQRLLIELGIAGTLVLLLGLVYALAVHRLFIRPVEELAATARQVTGGDLEARVRIPGDGPAARIAADFDEMVDILVASLQAEVHARRELETRTEELAAANRHKSHFLANVSHELKTPLNAIIGFADILAAEQHGELSPRQQEYVRRIAGAGDHLLAMISDLIDAAKLDLGGLRLEPAPTDVAAVVRDTVELLRPQAEAKNLELTVETAAVASVELDARRLRQIVANLLGNAIKFTPAGGHIAVRAGSDGDGLFIAVADDGIGIEPADQERIFEDFVQLDSQLHRHHEGTGIGLALSRRLAELMGGAIVLNSAPGEGSTFTVTLPCGETKEAS